MPAAALKENENEGGAGAGWVQRLREITGWSRPCPAAGGGWGPVQPRAGTQLPGDCRRMAGTFGVGGFDGLPGPEPGAVDGPSGRRAADLGGHGTQRICTAGGCRARTLTAGPWRSAPSTPMDTALACPAAQFVCRILLDAHHPDTPAHHVGTHWFMTYDDGRDPHPAPPGPPDTPPPRRRPRPPWGAGGDAGSSRVPSGEGPGSAAADRGCGCRGGAVLPSRDAAAAGPAPGASGGQGVREGRGVRGWRGGRPSRRSRR
ncbi:hypothetical protein BX260_7910 [Streptomyces sp. 5112.2]|nr:hypothetical protein BX260_7910 [Streptomyces sp. 5112.2]